MTFSIVIPAYNGEKYIEQAILSALNQTRKPDEVLIHDDNSSDATTEICAKYKTEVKYYFNPDGPSGFVNGWNKAIALAKFDFISILHQDDYLKSTFLEESENAIKLEPDVKHLFSLCDYIDENNKVILESEKEIGSLITKKMIRYSGNEYLKAYQKNYSNMLHIHRCPGVITHKSIFEDRCNYNYLAGHIADDDFFYRVGQFTSVVGIMKSLAAFRIHKDSETGSIGDINLVKRLSSDYYFQIKQWGNSDFLDKDDLQYFVIQAFKYTNRLLGYGLKKMEIDHIKSAIQMLDLLDRDGLMNHNKSSINILIKVLKRFL